MTSWSGGRGSLREPSEGTEREERDQDVHGWWVNGIFRLLEGVDNDDGHGVRDRVLPSCEIVE